MKYFLPKFTVVMLAIVAFSSCEEEFSSIDTNIIDQTFDTELDDSRTVRAYSKRLNGVQTNGLPVYQIGKYNDPVFGPSKVDLLTQVRLSSGSTEPNFKDCTVVDSVVLYIPFFSTASLDEEETTFELDSVYGNSPINIQIYESNFFLRNLDPNGATSDTQKYFSNQGPEFDGFLGDLIYTIEDFVPSAEPHPILTTVVDDADGETEELSELDPGIRVKLPIEFFEEKIIANEGGAMFINNNNFTEFFRGLYFKVEAPTDEGTLALLNLVDGDNDIENDARIELFYTSKTLESGEDCENTTSETSEGVFELNFLNAISVNLYENQLPGNIEAALGNSDPSLGDERLYLQGGDGIMTVIDLFGDDENQNGIADELEDLRDRAWLINEANLVMYVDQENVPGGTHEPERLILFDANNNRILADFSFSLTSNLAPIDALTDHLGRLERGSDENGDFYKLRITNHVSNLINRDSTNVSLGLMVTQNVLETNFTGLQDDVLPAQIEEIPSAAVVANEGTILHGNRSSNSDRRLKLQIFYTEPD